MTQAAYRFLGDATPQAEALPQDPRAPGRAPERAALDRHLREVYLGGPEEREEDGREDGGLEWG